MDVVQKTAASWRRVQPDLNVDPLLVVGRVQRLWALWDARLRPTFADAGLQTGDFDVLASLRRAQTPMAPGDLAKAGLVTAGATTKRVDRLVQAGLAERIENPEADIPRDESRDRRHRFVQITPSGVHTADELMAQHLAVQAHLLTCLTPAEHQQLEGLLTKVLAAAEGPDHARPSPPV